MHAQAHEDDTAMTISGVLEPSGLSWESRWEPYPSHSVVHAAIRITNETATPVDLGALPSLRLTVPVDVEDDCLLVLAGGRWDESMPPRGYRLQTFDVATINRHWFGVADDGRSSGEYIPWLALHGAHGGVLVGLVWSGRWRLNVERTPQGLALDIGLADFSCQLAPGASVDLPGLVLAGFRGTLDDGTNGWKRWLREHWAPPLPKDWPWVQYNHWYAYYGDIDEARLLEEAALAAEAGAEVFVIDDGWFQGRQPDSYFLGWGNWVEDRAKFPDGIKRFSDRIHSLGMKFGIWMEPERIDHTGALAREHPGWLASRDGAPIYRVGRRGHEGVHLCLGNPEVQQWVIDEVVRVVRDYGVDWLKWDYNMGYGLGCNNPAHGHQAGDGHYAHTQGVYRVLAAIREACPDLVIENCASGGHRIGLGMLRHTHTSWVSDYTHRAASCRQHSMGGGLFLPQEHVNTWVLERRNDYEFLSRMGGAFGFSSNLGRWSASERASLARSIGTYRSLRPYLFGDRYLLTGPWHQNWEVWQFLHPDQDDAVLLGFRDEGEINEITVALAPTGGKRWRIDTARSAPSSNDATAISVDGAEFRVRLGRSQEALVVWLCPDT
jgi:alpha-galactosidase